MRASGIPIARRGPIRAGVVLGAASLIALTPAPAAAATQSGWRFCTKCRGLFFRGSGSTKPRKKKNGKKKTGNASPGICPAGGKHAPRSDLSYVLHTADSLPSDPQLFEDFQQCSKCRGLFSNDSGDTGVCPAGGSHGSGDVFFALWEGATVPGMDDAWDQCAKCRGVYNWAGSSGAGVCPITGGHARTGSTRYTLFVLS